MGSTFRTGIGFDVHRFVDGRLLKLGGITIPYPKGLMGHSDADVLLHAIADACLGTIGKGDIGSYFPDSDPKYKGLDSRRIMQLAINLLHQENAEIVWMDAIIITELPKILPFVDRIKTSIAGIAGIPASRISIKGKTTEGLGFTGRQEGIAVQAAVTIRISDE
ncbi:2-C-methyl-D-erythritol 2,4-cyclodiphosphate synthase [bacterium]|nr:2-C-methyl-D-erythritol 2,4-cyclodiphosphate synthase [candidate division CSSED10-310 bacterium]